MFDNSLHSRLLLLAGLACLAAAPAAAQTTTVPALTVTQLTPSNDDEGSFGPPIGFGAAVGISGTTAVVGIPLYDLLDASGNAAAEEGRVAVFTQGSDGTWTRTASVIPADRQSNESLFGDSLALANNILIVGSSLATRIFVNEGGTWTQTATLPQTPAPVAFNGETYPNIAFDGHYFAFVANAPTSSGGSGSNAPAYLLYVYSVGASGQPQLIGTLSPSNLAPGGIALVNGILAVKGLDSSGNGSVYVYSENSSTPTVPQVLSSGESTPDSTFGDSIAIWNQTILVGAPGADGQPNDNTGGYFSGAAYVFALGSNGWVQTQKIVPNNSASFATAVALSQAGALISAPYSDDNFADILGNTQIYVWQGNQLVFAQNMPGYPPPTGTSMALSSNAAIIGTFQDAAQYGFYEYADIITVTPGSSASP
jgi:FG-GAP repeat